ncbi:EamA domain-containing membrane protein RarD [Algoriphagus boseongensis]|uniref:EamA domain-containing membrane protein RarD n=1 Tax=Algoriphagus boseongensis TaxID=1442587 RepID=A0A4R6T6H0_9BACT|nr:DMT family transporter [Algoriphagus boseongensis]TDQ17634.1 EamA domain-containing membrane protein RarD [Algoriphagus boseongensis]
MRSTDLKDYLHLHFIVMIWGITAILGLLISLPSLELVFYRTLIAAFGVGLIVYFRKQTLSVTPRELLKIASVGVLISLHWILFFWSARVSTASVCLAGMATTSLWTAFLEPLVNRSKIKWYEVALGLLVISGLLVIFQFETGYWLGLSMALAAAFLAALFSVLNGRLTLKHSPYQITFYEMAAAALFALIFMPISSHFLTDGEPIQWAWKGMDWVWILILSGVCTVYAFSASVELMKRLPVFSINLTINLEPVYGIVLAVIVFGEKEKMTPQFYLGTLIILISVLIYPALNYWNRRKKVFHGIN